MTSEDREAKVREAKDALLGAMFADDSRVWEVVALDTISSATGDPVAWLIADIAHPCHLDPRSRPSKRALHRELFEHYTRVGFGSTGV